MNVNVKKTGIFIVLLALWFAGCGGGSGGGNDDGSQQRIIRDVDFGSVVAETKGAVGPGTGNTSLMVNDIRVEVPEEALNSSHVLRIVHGQLAAAPARGIGTDIIYLASDERPLANGDYSLTLPLAMAPEEIDSAEVGVYAWRQGEFLVPVDAVIDVDAGTATITRPDVTVMYPPVDELRAMQTYDPNAPSTDSGFPEVGYVLGHTQDVVHCALAAPGEVHQEAEHSFTIFIKEQTTCDFVKSVSRDLQDALEEYNSHYLKEDGSTPFSHLDPSNRMPVYLGNYPGVNGEYKFLSWNGYIQVDIASGERNQTGLRETLFHEMFHAVQDVFSNMYVAGNVSMWWYEATAEWAGLNARGVTLGNAAVTELTNYNYFLSIPVQDSRAYAGGNASYAFCTMIYPAESNNPGYLVNTLRSWSSLSGTLYRELLDASALESTYGNWLRTVLESILSNTVPWTSGRIFESTTATRVYLPESTQIGAGDVLSSNSSDPAERYKARTFTVTIEPMTTRFYQLQTSGANTLTPARKLSVDITHQGEAWENSWLVKRNGSAPYELTFSRPSAGGDQFKDLGKTTCDVVVAVYNPSSHLPKVITVTMTIESGETNIPTVGICPQSLTVEKSGGEVVTLHYTSLTHPYVNTSYCNYEQQGVSGTAIWLTLAYGPLYGACGESAMSDVLYKPREAKSVLRTISASWVFSGSFAATAPVMYDDEAVLVGHVARGVEAGLGEACP